MKLQALYVRVSTEAQAEEGFSIEAQKQRLLAFCQAKDWNNHQFFVDGGFSGSHLDRPAIHQLISAVEQGKVERVLVYKLDRLSRSQKDTLFLIEDVFMPKNVDFISLNESIDTSTPYGRAMIGILSAFAQLERENIFLRTRMGMLERVKQGYWMGGGNVPFGYNYDKELGILVPNSQEAELVKHIYQLYLKGYSPLKISHKLALPYEKMVTQIIDRRSNLGIIPYKGKEYQGRHEAIISQEIFQKAQEMRRKRQSSARAGGIHLLSGLIFCGNCGNRMRYLRWGKAGYKLRCYSQDKSKSYMNSGKNCHAQAVWAKEVEAVVEADLLGVSLDFQAENQDIGSASQLFQEEIRQQQLKLRRFYQLYAQDQDETLLKLIGEQRDKLLQLSKNLEEEKILESKAQELAGLKEKIKGLGEIWEFLSQEEKQSIYRDCITKIEINGEKLSVFYRFIIEKSGN